MQDDQLDNIALQKHFLSSDKLTATEKLVAIAAMSHRNNTSMMCCPGQALLSKETCFNRRTIQRAINNLIEKKEIVRLQIKHEKIYRKSQYYFLFDIEKAKELFNDEDSRFRLYCYDGVDNFEHCLQHDMF